MSERCRPIGLGTLAGAADEPKGRAIWLMSDFEALVFIAIVALMVALAVTVAWQ